MRFLPSSPWALAALAGLILLLSSLCGFSLFFPAESLRPQLYAAASGNGLRLSIDSLETTFPLGLTAQGVTISSRANEQLAVKIERIALSPAWSSLLLGRGVIDYHATLLGGQLYGSLQRRGPLTLHGEGLTWRAPLPGLNGTRLLTHLRQVDGSIFWPIQAEDELSLHIDCDQTSIEGLLGAKNPVQLGNIALTARGKGKELLLSTLSVHGGQLAVDGTGSILLNAPLGRSLLNLNLTLRSAAGLDPALFELLNALVPPGTDGTSRLRLGGTLAAPQKGR